MDETDHIYKPYGLTTNHAINIPEDLVGEVEGEKKRVDVHIGYVDELLELMQKINGSSIVVVQVEATSPMPTQPNVVAPLPT
jgi:hypothetical protein